VVEQQVELAVCHCTFMVVEFAVSGKTETLSQTVVTDYIFKWLITQENFIAC
jgi:hypothetical protein